MNEPVQVHPDQGALFPQPKPPIVIDYARADGGLLTDEDFDRLQALASTASTLPITSGEVTIRCPRGAERERSRRREVEFQQLIERSHPDNPPWVQQAEIEAAEWRRSRAIVQAVRASMPGPKRAARLRACHVVLGARSQRAAENLTRPAADAVGPIEGRELPRSGAVPEPSDALGFASATARVSRPPAAAAG